ncbi:DUF6438 domain-containing protein [Elizabethkingia meningoseptica]|uniref:DUF6438 domain-containing protein n=1 Tax=Elizabethkingia meningoseptica TaxID=238 RepID=UPI0020135D6F|nr:DUF6438 domain-containing protein [Elizabethkingia meningoseptica]MCL1674736.1 DUF6438 domain-containing protein [Elizabethkingia meningoseptica]MCL1685896.1 DUF6438 domain-containing protein [Elizabethkingia meningoseptica]
MTRIFLFFIFMLAVPVTLAQKRLSRIDSIQDEKAAEALIHSFGENYEKLKVKKIQDYDSKNGGSESCRKIADSLKITQSYYKADFDHNGLTDILIITQGSYSEFYIFIVMDYGKKNLKIKKLTRGWSSTCSFPKIINNAMIRYYYTQYPKMYTNEKVSFKNKDLLYKYDDFIEYNPHPVSYNIEKIEYYTTGCYGSCPIFTLSVNQDKTAYFKAKRYNKPTRDAEEITGDFKTRIDRKSYNEIISLLNYIDFPNLKDEYDVNWTDDQTSYLTITYNNGKKKAIRDYGMIGTYGLDRLYELFFQLRFNQKWLTDPKAEKSTE